MKKKYYPKARMHFSIKKQMVSKLNKLNIMAFLFWISIEKSNVSVNIWENKSRTGMRGQKEEEKL